MSSFALPLEGITLEYLTIPFRSILLQPLLTGAALLTSYQSPQQAEKFFSFVSQNKLTPALLNKGLKVLFAAGILYRLNNLLTNNALNPVTDNSWDWQREVVLVTGGCSGIGELTVRKLAENNIKVVIFDVSEPKATLPKGVTFYKVDITSSEKIHEAAEKVRREVGHPSVLVNNAGIGMAKPMLEKTEAQIRSTFNVNIVAHFLLVREFLPEMIKRNHGHVVTIASMASFLVHAGNVDYACTKAAALAFHEGLTGELRYRYGASKVKTTVVHPTWVRTPLIDPLIKTGKFNEFTLEPQSVANAVVSQIMKGQSAQLVLPGRLTFVTGVRGWPNWLQQAMRNSVANTLKGG